MEREVIQRRFDQAQATVRLATYHIRQQLIRVIQLGREGREHEAALARDLLTNLEDYLALHVAERDRIVRELLDFDRGLQASDSASAKDSDGVDRPR